MGLYLNRGSSSGGAGASARACAASAAAGTETSTTTSTIFADHSSDTITIRQYINPSTIFGSPSDYAIFYINMNSFYKFGTGIKFSGTTGANKLLWEWITSNTFFFDSSLQLITRGSWVDLSITYTYSEDESSTLNMNEKIYSTGWDRGPLTLHTGGSCPSDDKSSFTSFDLDIVNNHYIDTTIQYISIVNLDFYRCITTFTTGLSVFYVQTQC